MKTQPPARLGRPRPTGRAARGPAQPAPRRWPGCVRGALLALCLAAVGPGVLAMAGAAQDGTRDGALPSPVAAPHYGDTLFRFYQDQHFSAITGLMVSQHFGRIAPHDDEAELLRGGMMLGYGLHEQAAAVFDRLIEGRAPAAVRDRAWYFLARLRHQRGLPAQAQEALDRIRAPLQSAWPGPGEPRATAWFGGGPAPLSPLEEDRQLLQAQLMLARQEPAAAALVLDALKGSATAGLYARFNLGVALIKTGEPGAVERGTALLDGVGQAPGATEELRSLRDRANVALGFAALQGKKPREARVALQRVRLNGAQANKALLGYGWAAAELNDPALALVPWTELAAREVTDASVLEAHIAVPYAMSELGAYGAALERYRAADDTFSREKRALDASIAAIRGGALVQGLLARNPLGAESDLGAWARLDTLPELPHTAHLVPLLAEHPFQQAFRHLRDLQFLRGNLSQWQASLGSFTDMLDNRKAAFASRLPAVRAQAGAVNLPGLAARRDALAAELSRAEGDSDAAVFADARERALLERIERARATLAQAQGTPEGADLAGASERLRLAAGALTWQLAQRYSERSWAAKKALRDTDLSLAAARERDAALLKAQRDEPARYERFAARIAELGARLQALQPRVAALDAEAQAALQDLAVAGLQGQQERLDLYAAQARLAIAQILDRAQLAQRSDKPVAAPAAAPAAPPTAILPPASPGARP